MSRSPIKNIPRERDEAILRILDGAARGIPFTRLNKHASADNSSNARVAARRVAVADMAESGESRAAVAAGYPWMKW